MSLGSPPSQDPALPKMLSMSASHSTDRSLACSGLHGVHQVSTGGPGSHLLPMLCMCTHIVSCVSLAKVAFLGAKREGWIKLGGYSFYNLRSFSVAEGSRYQGSHLPASPKHSN